MSDVVYRAGGWRVDARANTPEQVTFTVTGNGKMYWFDGCRRPRWWLFQVSVMEAAARAIERCERGVAEDIGRAELLADAQHAAGALVEVAKL